MCSRKAIENVLCPCHVVGSGGGSTSSSSRKGKIIIGKVTSQQEAIIGSTLSSYFSLFFLLFSLSLSLSFLEERKEEIGTWCA